MGSTLTVLDGKLVRRLGINSADTLITSTVRTEAINAAIQQISLEHDWPWLISSPATITTAADDSTYDTPTRFLRTINIHEPSTGHVLKRRSITELDEVIATGRPEIYHVDNATITLKPTPNGIYTLTHRYYVTEAELSGGSDTTSIPSVHDSGIIAYAAYLCHMERREMARAAEAESQYNAWLKRARDNVNQSKEPIRVRVRPGSWF